MGFRPTGWELSISLSLTPRVCTVIVLFPSPFLQVLKSFSLLVTPRTASGRPQRSSKSRGACERRERAARSCLHQRQRRITAGAAPAAFHCTANQLGTRGGGCQDYDNLRSESLAAAEERERARISQAQCMTLRAQITFPQGTPLLFPARLPRVGVHGGARVRHPA